LKGEVKKLKNLMDYNNYGGAVLLGANKTIVKGHGSSKAEAVYQCIKQAYSMEANNLCQSIRDAIAQQR
jgi:glycerol-3-phosphate acyltransferase PlsX